MGNGASVRSKPVQSRAEAGLQPPRKDAKDTTGMKETKAVRVAGGLDQPRTSFTAHPPDTTALAAPAVGKRKAQALPSAFTAHDTPERVRSEIGRILTQQDHAAGEPGPGRALQVRALVQALMEDQENRSDAWRAEAARQGAAPADVLAALMEAVLACEDARYTDGSALIGGVLRPLQRGAEYRERHGLAGVALHLPLITRLVDRLCEPVEPMALARLGHESKSTPGSAPHFADHPVKQESMALLRLIEALIGEHEVWSPGAQLEARVARPLAGAVRLRSPSSLRPLLTEVLRQSSQHLASVAEHSAHLTQFMARLTDASVSQRYAALCAFCVPDPVDPLAPARPEVSATERAQVLLHDVQSSTPPQDLAMFMHALVVGQSLQNEKEKGADAALLACVGALLERHASLSSEQLLCGALGLVMPLGLGSGAQARLERLRLVANEHAQRPASTGQAAFTRAYELAADPLAICCALDFDATQPRVLLVLGCVVPGLWNPVAMNEAVERIMASELLNDQKADLCRELVRGHLPDLSAHALGLVHGSLLSLSDPDALSPSAAVPASTTLLDFYRDCEVELGIAALRRQSLGSFTPQAVALARAGIDQAERVLRILLKQLNTAMPAGQEALRDTLRTHLLVSLDLLGEVLECADTVEDGRDRKGSPSQSDRLSSTSTSTSTSTASSYTTSSSVPDPDPDITDSPQESPG